MSDQEGPNTTAPVDPYCYLGTDVLVNKLGITNAAALRQAEYFLSTYNQATIGRVDINADGLKAVHQHLFGDLYDWAGHYRTENLARVTDDGTNIVTFADVAHLDRTVNDLFAQHRLHPNPTDPFELAGQAAALTGALNWAHPFREGNGRTVRVFLTHWAHQHGYRIDFRSWTNDEWRRASIASYHSHHEPMIDLVTSHLQRLDLGELQRTVVQWGQAHHDVLRLDKLIDHATDTFQFATSIQRDTLTNSLTDLRQRRDATIETIHELEDRLTRDAHARGVAAWRLTNHSPTSHHQPDHDTIARLGATRQFHDTWTTPPHHQPTNPGPDLDAIQNIHQHWTERPLHHHEPTTMNTNPQLHTQTGPELGHSQ